MTRSRGLTGVSSGAFGSFCASVTTRSAGAECNHSESDVSAASRSRRNASGSIARAINATA